MKTKQGTNGMHKQPHRLWVLLTLLVAASFAVRVAALAYWGTGAIESEGAEYTRIAENLRNGVGYVGIVTPGPQLNFNPLFPLLIAGASFVTHNYEWAGRLVALVMGVLLPLPVFGIASRLFNRRVGFIAAILTLLHPLLVNLSFTVFSEGPYTALFLSATYLAVVALSHNSTRMWALVGAAFGLTWLLRAEASAAFAIAVLFALTATQGDRKVRCKRAMAAIAVFLALALPEVIFIYRSTGKVRLEGKSTIFFYTGKRILAAERNPGVDYQSPGGLHEVPSPAPNAESWQRWQDKWAFYGIDSNLKGMGFPLRPHAEVIRGTQITFKDLFLLLAKGVRQNAPVLLDRFSAEWFGAPFLPALALLGALRRPWRRSSQASSRLFVVLVAAAPMVATFFALWSDPRYYFVYVPLLCIWAANGLVEIGLWAKATTAAAGWSVLARPALSQYIFPGLVGLAMIVSPVKAVRKLYLFTDSAPPHVDKQVGLWIGRQQNRSVRIIDLSIPLAYHAGAQFTYFPYCSGDLALHYLDAAHVDYVVLRRGEKFTQYYQDWLAHGIPDPRAELLQVSSVAGADNFLVYRWHGSEYVDTSRSVSTQTQNDAREGSLR